MVILRNRLSNLRAGGPRQFTELRDRLIVTASTADEQAEVARELAETGFATIQLDTADVVIAEPRNRIEDVLERVASISQTTAQIEQALDDIRESRENGGTFFETTEATLNATDEILNQIRGIPNVGRGDFIITSVDYGPENLRLSPTEMITIPTDQATEEEGNLEDVNNALNLPEAWSMTRGEGVAVAIFDTGYAEDLISEDRIIETYHGSSVDSVFAPAEGHGTMTAGTAVANRNEGVPYNGAAPEADVILVRITDNEGQIRSDVVAQAWDWINQLDLDQPIVTNHSYGTPLCSGRPRTRFCEDPLTSVIDIVNEDQNITSLYAAGNEAGTCGHRLSGVTSGVTGHNSLGSVITVGALLTSGRDAQRYSSHGRGDCSPVADPKPNWTARIPKFTYYGVSEGWQIKDMSTGPFGSSGGTSHATPYSAGLVALLQSRALDERGEALSTEEVKQIVQETAEPPRITQVNAFGLFSEKGYDARFGHGEINIVSALERI